MRILVCGDRNWTDYAMIRNELAAFNTTENRPITVIDGVARGADFLGHEAALGLGYGSIRFPAKWAMYGRGAGHIRNQQMLDEGHPDLVLAFHDDLAHSKGTAHMVRIARKAGIPVRVVRH